MADVNAWSIIVPGVITPAVVAAFAFSQQRAERRQNAVEELRVVIDEAARRVAEADLALRRYRNCWRTGSEISADVYERAANAVNEIEHAIDRLVVRVGERAELAATYAAVWNLIVTHYARLQHGVREGEPYPADEMKDFFKAVAETRADFMRAAKKVVGRGLVGVRGARRGAWHALSIRP
jgi:hypothetical protein